MKKPKAAKSGNRVKELPTDKQPQFVLFMGGVASGKTTMRRQQYAKGYVHIDAAEIFAQLTGGQYAAFPGAYLAELESLGSKLAKDAVNAKKNIVMEIIGDSLEMQQAIAEAVSSIGYSVHAQVLTCSVEEAQRRHKHACDTDVNYISAYYTQVYHQKWILDAVKGF